MTPTRDPQGLGEGKELDIRIDKWMWMGHVRILKMTRIANVGLAGEQSDQPIRSCSTFRTEKRQESDIDNSELHTNNQSDSRYEKLRTLHRRHTKPFRFPTAFPTRYIPSLPPGTLPGLRTPLSPSSLAPKN